MFQTLKTFLPAVMLTAALTFAGAAPSAAEGLTKEAVQKIVHDYIMEHPDVILDAVNQYQQRTMEEKQKAAVETNREFLFRDERSPVIGNPEGDVTIVEFFDYNCGYCKRAYPTIKEVLAQDKKIRLVFKELPILGPTSETASRFALAAHAQGKYHDFHERLMTNKVPVNEDVLIQIATDLKLDLNKLRADAEGTEVMMQIERNRALAQQMAINGTPAFVIGNRVAPGAIPKAEILKMIEETRKAAPKDGKKD